MSNLFNIILLLFIFSLTLVILLVSFTLCTYKFQTSSFEIKKDFTVISIVLLTAMLFIVTKILLKGETPIHYILGIILLVFFINQFTKKEWDKIFINLSWFRAYLRFMLLAESWFLSSFISQVTFWLVYYTILDAWLYADLKYNIFLNIIYFSFLFMALLYFRLRLKVFKITELVKNDPVLFHELNIVEVEKHFLKMFGVHLGFNKPQYSQESKIVLFGFPKRSMMGGGYIGKISRNLGQVTVAGIMGVAMKIRNDDIAQENNSTLERFRTRWDAKLGSLENKKNALFQSREEFHDPVRQAYVNRQLDAAHSQLQSVDSWMRIQNGMVTRFVKGSIYSMPYFHEQQRKLLNKLDDVEFFLDNIAKEEMLGSSSKALVPYVIPKSVGYDFTLSEVVGFWV
jgi:hypothetical protein